ncbi:hypothetical protein [Nocardioides endophyticus]|uniref:hypothetical protein n=1 Tax=Nocardioides endophyticus TaxID=1353775 RepID=UPI0031E74930
MLTYGLIVAVLMLVVSATTWATHRVQAVGMPPRRRRLTAVVAVFMPGSEPCDLWNQPEAFRPLPNVSRNSRIACADWDPASLPTPTVGPISTGSAPLYLEGKRRAIKPSRPTGRRTGTPVRGPRPLRCR